MEDLGDGLYRIPLPLPGDALTAVNVYAMVSDNGVDLVDAGMAITQARERLTEALGQLGFGLPDIRNFFITHIHQDHYTLAVELRTTLRGQIVLGEREYAERTRQWLQAERPWFAARLAALGLGVVPGAAANFLLCSLPLALAGRVRELQRRLGAQGILIRDASRFAGLDGSWLRLAVKLRGDNERLLAALAETLQDMDMHGSEWKEGDDGRSV